MSCPLTGSTGDGYRMAEACGHTVTPRSAVLSAIETAVAWPAELMGLRSAAPLAQFMGYYLNYIFDNVHLVSSGATDVFEEISKLKENDVLVGISFPRYSSRTLEAMRFAKRCGAQVVAITDGPMSPLTGIADATLTARTDMASFVDSLAAPLSLINALLVALGLHRKEALTHHFRQLESIWETYEVYLEEASNHA